MKHTGVTGVTTSRHADDDVAMGDDTTTARALQQALGFAELVHRVLPVDHEADRAGERFLRERAAKQKSRKLMK